MSTPQKSNPQDRQGTTMEYQRINKSSSWNPPSQKKSSLVRTRNDAVNQLNTARTNTIAYLAPHLNEFARKWTTFENTPPGPAKGVAGQARNQARQAIIAQANAIPRPSPNLLQVTVQNPMVGGAIPVGQIPNRVADMVQIRQRYRIVIDHGRNLGPSFQGTGPHGANPWVPHPATAPAAAPQSTLTVLQPGVNSIFNAPAAATWPLVTHYPTQAPPPPFGIDF